MQIFSPSVVFARSKAVCGVHFVTDIIHMLIFRKYACIM